MTRVPVTPERALRLALVGWGLGDLAMGRMRAGMAWLSLEAILLAATTAATLLLAETTWYLAPFLLGVAFLAIWAAKAVATYRHARSLRDAAPMAPQRSPALTIAWLAIPLLAWGTGFWLLAAEHATPAAVVDRFVARWPDVDVPSAIVSYRGPDVDRVGGMALAELTRLCALGRLADDCADAPQNLLRDVRVSVEAIDTTHAVAVAELVEYRQESTRLLGIFEAGELVPVAVASVLRLELEALPAALGSREWVIVNARLQ
ncbi:MAG TPA: hypothetical protein VHK63_08230 [Candidatus Limnocylindria bacterium]|nr:hypothetical protein [Candidatus Limnocylindria bacterium]